MKRHHLKCVQPYFSQVWRGIKKFEIRLNDRDYKEGDILILKEWSQEEGYSGREIFVPIEYITDFADGLRDGWVCMSLGLVERWNEPLDEWGSPHAAPSVGRG